MTKSTLTSPLLNLSVRPFLRRSLFASLAAGALFAAGHAGAQEAKAPSQPVNPDQVVARINGLDIREGDLAVAEDDIGENLPKGSPEQKRDYLITYMSDLMLVAKAAEGKNLANTPEFNRRVAYLRNKALMELLLKSEASAAATEPEMRKVYDDATKQMKPQEEVHAHHILVETEAEAKTVLADIKKGGDFAAIAKEKSKDPSAKAEGGDLGYFTADQMVPEFSTAAFKLEKGQLSEPVKTQFGWHVIKLEDKRTKPVPTFEQVKDQIQSYVVQKAQAELITKLRSEGKVERLDKPAEKK